MRVLFTGFSSRECDDTKKESMRFDMNEPVLEACRAVGEVDRRRVRVGEEVRGYDLVVVCCNQALSFNTRHGVLGSLWALAHVDVPTVVYFHDWQVRAQMSHLRTLQKHPHYLNKRIGKGDRAERLFHTEDDETTSRHADQLLYGAQRLTNPWDEGLTALTPTFTWGKHDMLLDTIPVRPDRLACADLSPFGVASVDPAPDVHPNNREVAWLLPSLTPQDGWVEKLDVEWPVHYLGSRKLKAERVSEQEVYDRTAAHAGLLSPRYPFLSGSGWWRLRFCYTASLGALIAGDPEEAGCLGPAFQRTPAELEAMYWWEREVVRMEQRALMEASYWSGDQARQYLQDVLVGAAQGRAVHPDQTMIK